MVLTRLLASLHDERGNVAVDGLVSGPAPDVPHDEAQLRKDGGVLDGVHLIGDGSIPERLWTRPAITVIGLDAAPTAGAGNTLAPSARAMVSVRLAPGDDPEPAYAAVRAHLERHVPWGAHMVMTPGFPPGRPVRVDTAGPAFDAARAAFKEAWDGVDLLEIGTGGSIPIIDDFARTFPGAAVLVTGVEDPDTRAHSPNEGLHLADWERVCHAEALLLHHLGGSRMTVVPSRVPVCSSRTDESPALRGLARSSLHTCPLEELRMGTLTVWKFDSAGGADEATKILRDLASKQLITIEDAATVRWDEGKKKPKTRQLNNLAGAGALGGAFWGMLFGLIFFVPLLGAAIGAASGALGGALSDVGIDDDFINRIRDEVTPGTSALFLMSSGAVVDKVRDSFGSAHPELVFTSLSEEQERALREVFAEED